MVVGIYWQCRNAGKINKSYIQTKSTNECLETVTIQGYSLEILERGFTAECPFHSVLHCSFGAHKWSSSLKNTDAEGEVDIDV